MTASSAVGRHFVAEKSYYQPAKLQEKPRKILPSQVFFGHLAIKNESSLDHL